MPKTVTLDWDEYQRLIDAASKIDTDRFAVYAMRADPSDPFCGREYVIRKGLTFERATEIREERRIENKSDTFFERYDIRKE